MTRFVVGDDRSQSTLFPERLDRPQHRCGWNGSPFKVKHDSCSVCLFAKENTV